MIQMQHIPEFTQVAQVEFFSTHPDIARQWLDFLNQRFSEVESGQLNEMDYLQRVNEFKQRFAEITR